MPQSLVSGVNQRYGALYAPTKLGVAGLVANQAGTATSAALAPTYTGLCLSNPAGSGKNLVLLHVAANLVVAPAAATAFMLIVGWSAAGIVTHTTPLTPLNAMIGGTPKGVALPALVGLADAACTLVGAPAFVRAFGQTTGATANAAAAANIEGGIIIPPGGYVAIGTNIASPAAGVIASMTWEEEPV